MQICHSSFSLMFHHLWFFSMLSLPRRELIISVSSVVSKHKWYPLKRVWFILLCVSGLLLCFLIRSIFTLENAEELRQLTWAVLSTFWLLFLTKQLYANISEYKLYSISMFPLDFSLSCYFASWNALPHYLHVSCNCVYYMITALTVVTP